MRHQIPVIPLCTLASLITLLLFSSPVGAARREKRSGFSAEARHIVSLVGHSGSKALNRFASRRGILVVRREVDWKRTGKPFREPNTGDPVNLYLGGLDPQVWVEVETEFDRRDLTGRRFGEIGARFQRFVQSTREGFQGEDYSLDMLDAWNSRRLGPAAEGKLCAGSYWYIYFVREKGRWRVWKLELAIR
jgi:hypothetical protein